MSDRDEEKEKVSLNTQQAHVRGLKCDRCHFTLSAHADRYCPDAAAGQRFISVAARVE